ncbi:MAG: hypothetical protein LJF04_02020 [Gemmatimonadetes bacterium]|nr:hypothetical protein [Gemmatimonadota bacterium]
MSEGRREKRSGSRPRPARAGGPAVPAAESATPQEAKATPAPARALLETQAPEVSPPAAPETTLRDPDGGSWIVSVRGRSVSGSSSGRASLLLLAFEPADDAEAELECLVVAERLQDLTQEQLAEALERARRPPAPGSRKEIFPEVGGRNRLRNG